LLSCYGQALEFRTFVFVGCEFFKRESVRVLRSHLLIFAILISTFPVAGAPAAEAPTVSHWFVDSLIKVFPEDSALKHKLAQPDFLGARNSHVSLQWVLRTRQRLEYVSVKVTGFDGSGGN
jgi:hypothetical protein